MNHDEAVKQQNQKHAHVLSTMRKAHNYATRKRIIEASKEYDRRLIPSLARDRGY